MKDALALAFNKAGGSMQSNIDGSLAVRVIQGFVSQSGSSLLSSHRAALPAPRIFSRAFTATFTFTLRITTTLKR